MMTPTRAADFASWESAAPYLMAMLLSASVSRGKLKLYLRANFALASGLSNEQPRMTAFFWSYSGLRSRNPQPSDVQPGVSAFG